MRSLSDSPPVDRMFRISTDRAGGVLVVTVTGEIDMVTAPGLHETLAQALERVDGEPIIVDLTNVTFLASRGISVLISATAQARRRGRQLRLVVGQARPARRPLQVLRLDGALPLCTTMREAVTSLTEPAPTH